MFTINTQWALGKSGVRWGVSEKAPQDQQSIDPVDKAKALIKEINLTTFAFSKTSKIQELHDIVKSIENTEVAKRTAIFDLVQQELGKPTRTQEVYDKNGADAYYALPTEGDKRDYRVMLTKWSQDYAGINTNFLEAKTVITTQTAKEVKDVKKLNTTVVWQSEQAIALGKILSVDAKTNPVIENLKDTNIPSLLSMVTTQPISKLEEYIKDWTNSERKVDVYTGLQNLGYSPNGGFGSTELSAVKNFIEYYLKSSSTDKDKIQQAAKYTRAGLATTISQKSIEGRETIQDVDTVISYLTDLPDARFRADDIRKALQSRKGNEKAFIAMINRVTGGNAVDMTQLITDLKTKTELKARFYENINTAGANRSTTLGQFLDGKWAEKAKERVDSITKILNAKVTPAVKDLESKSTATTDPTEKAKIDAILAEYNKKGDSWLTGEIRKVAEGAFVNIGKNANTVGAGMSFETFLKWLTVNLGAGISNGKVGPAAVIHYDIASGEITQTEKKIIEGSIGAGTSVFPAVIPFVDVGLKAIDKISVYGDGAGKIRSSGLNAMIANGGGSLSLAFLEERKSEIDQGTKLMNSVIDKFSKLNESIIADDIIKVIESQPGMSITPIEASYWADRMTQLYQANRVRLETSPEAKAILIKGLVEVEGEKKHTQEAMNDVDGRSYKGFSVGVGHLFGVTFPLVGVYFKEGKIQYNYPKTQEAPKATSPSIVIPKVLNQPKTQEAPKPTPVKIESSSTELIDMWKDETAVILSRRGKKNFNAFQIALNPTTFNLQQAKEAIMKDLNWLKNPVALRIASWVNNSPDDTELQVRLMSINAATSGSQMSRIAMEKVRSGKDLSSDKKLLKEVASRKESGKNSFTGLSTALEDLYGVVRVKNLLKNPNSAFTNSSDINNGNFFGSVNYDQKLGKAKGENPIMKNVPLFGWLVEVKDTERNTAIDTEVERLQKMEKPRYDQLIQQMKHALGRDIGTGELAQYLKWIKITGENGRYIQAVDGGAKAYLSMAAVQRAGCFNTTCIITIPNMLKFDPINNRPSLEAPQVSSPEDAPDVIGAGFLATEVTSGLLGGLYNNPEDPKSAQWWQQDSTPGWDKTPATTPDQAPTWPHTNAPSTPVWPTPAPAPATNTPPVNIDA
jgi:hypothetical protein